MTACPTASVSRAARLLAAACSASLMLFVPPALADTLIEDVNGIRFDSDGNVTVRPYECSGDVPDYWKSSGTARSSLTILILVVSLAMIFSY